MIKWHAYVVHIWLNTWTWWGAPFWWGALGPVPLPPPKSGAGKHTPKRKFETKVRKEYQQLNHSYKDEDEDLTGPVTSQEIHTALQSTKSSKAAGPDENFPSMLKHLGKQATDWLAQALTNAISGGKYPITWKLAKFLAMQKPKKPTNNPASYRPISLLCCTFKPFERIILNRITLLFEEQTPTEQVGFRRQRNTIEQALAVTNYVEARFEMKKNKKNWRSFHWPISSIWHGLETSTHVQARS